MFWAKEPVKTEIINDTNGMVVSFYEVLKTDFNALKKAVDATPYSRTTYMRAMVVYDNPYLFDPIIKAWAFWMVSLQGFSNKIGSWRSSQPRCKESVLNANKKALLTEAYAQRLELVQMEQVDAVYLIGRMDTPETFCYIDPPYVGANQGHYGGYTQQHFETLIDRLAMLKGKFLLSSYPNYYLTQAAAQNGWSTKELEMPLRASKKNSKQKTEVLTANYQI